MCSFPFHNLATPLSHTSLSTTLAIIIGVSVTTVCIVTIFISLIVVAFICVKRTASNRPLDSSTAVAYSSATPEALICTSDIHNSNPQQSTEFYGCTTTEVQDDQSSLQSNPAYESISKDNPAYSVITDSRIVEDEAEYMSIDSVVEIPRLY